MKTADPETGWQVLKAFLAERSPLGPLRVMAARVGRFFQVPLPGFKPYIVFGPEAVRKVLVTERNKFLWRNHDPVTDLLQRGVLVTDGAEHDHYRALLEPALHPAELPRYTALMLRQTDRVTAAWKDGDKVDLLIEGRKIALLIVMEALFSVDAWDDLPQIWRPILKAIDFISPGAWILWRKIPRPGFKKPLKTLDDYLYKIIAARRASGLTHPDLLQHLLDSDLSDERIRDQMLTMLIAGHDTSTAFLAWTFVLLGQHPEIQTRLVAELEAAPAGSHPHLLDEVIKESLRLYPPIHIGNRLLAEEVTFGEGETIPAGERLFYSIYLTHRDPQIWENAEQFCPERFAPGRIPPTHAPPARAGVSFIPFGGGPRACLGAAFGLAEARIVLTRLLLDFNFQLLTKNIRPHMGATLEPRPGVLMQVTRRRTPTSPEVGNNANHPTPGVAGLQQP